MTEQHPEMQCDALLRRALVPKGHRPTKDEDIEKLLDIFGDDPISEDKLQRMLRKINGQEAIFPERSSPPPPESSVLTEHERELVALHRAQNKPLPPELAAKLKAMEDRASKRTKPDEDSAGG